MQGIDHYVNYLKISGWMKAILKEPDYSIVALINPSGKIIINTKPERPITESEKSISISQKLPKNPHNITL